MKIKMKLTTSLQNWTKALQRQESVYSQIIKLVKTQLPNAKIEFVATFDFQTPILNHNFDFQLTYNNHQTKFKLGNFLNNKRDYSFSDLVGTTASNDYFIEPLTNETLAKYYQWTDDILTQVKALNLQEFKTSVNVLNDNNIEVVSNHFNLCRDKVSFFKTDLKQNNELDETCLLDKTSNTLYYKDQASKQQAALNLNDLMISNEDIAPDPDFTDDDELYLCYSDAHDTLAISLQNNTICISTNPLYWWFLYPKALNNINFERAKLEELQGLITSTNRTILDQITNIYKHGVVINYSKIDRNNIDDALKQLNWFRALSYVFMQWGQGDYHFKQAIPKNVKDVLTTNYNEFDLTQVFPANYLNLPRTINEYHPNDEVSIDLDPNKKKTTLNNTPKTRL